MDGEERVGGMTDTADFLLELLSEEIPARMQLRAKEDLARLFTEALAKAGLAADSVETFATPRRLALIARGLPLGTAAVCEETKGPKVGAPPQAIEGFLRKTGLTQDQLIERDGVWFAVIDKPGRATADVLAEAIPAVIRAFPWPKSQRWGAASASTESLRWVRPMQGIVALLGEDVVPCGIDGIMSGRETAGHRFMHSDPVSIANAAAYVEALRAAHVIVHYSERCALIRDGARAAASAAGLALVEDEGLVSENAGLTEWPVPLLGRFDPAFLAVPEEVIQLTARVNQKYFVCRDAAGALAPAFVCTANIAAHDGGAAIIAGNEKVLSARLSDAKFFWETDLKVPLETQAAKLAQITFHEKLGTVADKVERVAKLARWLCEEGIVKPADAQGRHPGPRAGVSLGGASVDSGTTGQARGDGNGDAARLADLAERAARLAKADLVTGSVGEFPELQGIMGGHIARAQGEDDAVADAIRDHYKPVGQGDEVPTAPVTVAVSLADKLDTVGSFFGVNERPTGSKDPFALRRSALGILALIQTNGLRLSLTQILRNARYWLLQHGHRPVSDDDMLAFLADRLKIQQREAGVRHDIIDAAFALGGEDDLVRLLARVKAVQSVIETAEGADLLSAYKRAANILKQADAAGAPPVHDRAPTAPMADAGDEQIPQTGEEDPLVIVDDPALAGVVGELAAASGPTEGTLPEGAGVEDIALLGALSVAESRAAPALADEDYERAMAALAELRGPIDAFFDGVMVNDPDPAIRAFRLGLLARFRDAVHQVADFSKIEG